MKKVFVIFFIIMMVEACAPKTAVTAEPKKNESAVSVFDNSAPNNAATTKNPAPTTGKEPAAAATGAAVASNTVSPDSPKEVIKSYTAELQALYDEDKSKQKKKDKQIAEKVRKFFDFEALARESLGSPYYKMTTKKKKEYSDLFTELIEKSYLKRSQNLVAGYKLNYGKEIIKGSKSSVDVNIKLDDADFDITYELHQVQNRWMIYNIIFDRVNLASNYRTQFNQIVAKSGTDGLIDLMRKRLKEDTSEIDSAL